MILTCRVSNIWSRAATTELLSSRTTLINKRIKCVSRGGPGTHTLLMTNKEDKYMLDTITVTIVAG